MPKKPNHLRAAFLGRVSTLSQARSDRHGLNSQRKDSHFLAERLNIPIVAEYTDAISGKEETREGLERLLADAKQGAFEAVIVYNVSRIGRTERVSHDILYRLMEAGLTVYAANRGEKPIEEGFHTSIDILLAAEEHRNIRRNTRKGLNAEAEKGLLPHGIYLYGYYNLFRQNKCEIDLVQAEVVKFIFNMAAGGSSFYAITEELNKRAAKDAKWKPRRSDTWNASVVTEMIKNTTYRGERPWKYGKHSKVLKVPAIVSPELWQKAQRKGRGRKSKRNDPLLGHLECAYCGYSVTFHPITRTHKAKPYREGYYVCTSKIAQGRKRCEGQYNPAKPFKARVESAVREALTDPETILDMLQKTQQAEQHDTGTLDKLQEAEANLKESLELGDISPAEFGEMRRSLKKRIAEELERLEPNDPYPVEAYIEAAQTMPLGEMLKSAAVVVLVSRDGLEVTLG